MRICHVIASISRKAGGVFGSVSALVRRLAQEPGYDISVVALEDEYSGLDAGEWLPVTPRLLPVRGPRAFGYARGFIDAVHESRPDIVHCHGLWMYPDLAVNAWHDRTGGPYIVSPHGMLNPWALQHAQWKKIAAGRLYTDRLLRRAAVLHSLSAVESGAIRAYGLGNPVCQIPSWVDLPAAADGGGNAPWSGEPRNVLLYLGRYHPVKGLTALVEAWCGIRKQEHSASAWKLVLAGWGNDAYKNGLRRIVRKQNCEDSVDFLGPQYADRKEQCLRSASAFILPSLSEGLPIAVLEAWAHAVPVLMTAQCNLGIGFARRAAIEVTPSVEGIRQGLRSLFAMPDVERRTWGAQGRAIVQEQYSWKALLPDVMAMYAGVPAAGTSPAGCART